jgi:urease accessory protein
MAADLAAFLLADGRFPVGGHAHSAGVESAVADGRVHDLDSAMAFVRGRVRTAGLTDAALAAATAVRIDPRASAAERALVLRAIDDEADARIAPPPLRVASRRLGRQLVRAADRAWPHAELARVVTRLGTDPHQACAWGLVGVGVGLPPLEVARLVVHHTASTPAQAAVRLLGLDPFAVSAALVGLTGVGEDVALEAASRAGGPLAELPAAAGPVVEVAAVAHPTRPNRMFTT